MHKTQNPISGSKVTKSNNSKKLPKSGNLAADILKEMGNSGISNPLKRGRK